MIQERDIYFAACLGPTGQPLGAYKIGCSSDIDTRLRSVTACLPFSLDLIGTVPGGFFMEGLIHLYLRQHRIRGEYFHMNAETDDFIKKAMSSGTAFYYIRDDGFSAFMKQDEHLRMRDAFLYYHDVSLGEVAEFLGGPPSRFEGQNYAIRVVGAAAIIAQRRPEAHFCHFASDIMRGLMGKRHWAVEKSLPAPEAELEAA